jgi:hypothetical protein
VLIQDFSYEIILEDSKDLVVFTLWYGIGCYFQTDSWGRKEKVSRPLTSDVFKLVKQQIELQNYNSWMISALQVQACELAQTRT